MYRRASHLVTQLLRMARHEGGASAQRVQRVELDQLVKTCLADHLPLADKRRIDLGMVHDEPGILLGDAEALRILLDNLIDNAVRYTPPDGVVDVAVRTRAARILLEVSDTGPGIPAAMHERVFDRFYRIEGSGTEGSGLGLSIVRSIADRHGASVRVSNRPAGGTLIRVEFPSLAAQVG
jgi:two-component system OmpR family sensor kinase